METPHLSPTATHAAQWLSPTDALTRFAPPPADDAGESAASATTVQARHGFRVDGFGILVPGGTSGEVLENHVVYPVPRTAGWFSGLCNVRGNIVPVYDLPGLLGVERPAGRTRRVLVLGAGESAAGFEIDALPAAVQTGEPLASRPPLPPALGEHVTATYAWADEVWLEVDLESFLLSLGPRVPAG